MALWCIYDWGLVPIPYMGGAYRMDLNFRGTNLSRIED